MLRWHFVGGADGSQLAERRGEQRALAGDAVDDEILGRGNVLGFGDSTSFLRIEYIEEGEKVVRERTCGHIYVLTQREERTMRTTGGFGAYFGVTEPSGRPKKPVRGKAFGRALPAPGMLAPTYPGEFSGAPASFWTGFWRACASPSARERKLWPKPRPDTWPYRRERLN